MVAADMSTISVGRAQDWINTINPILDGLRRELRFLPNGPWRWHPKTRSFESFLPVKDYIQHPYLDNYDDLVEKREDLRQEFGVRDAVLAAFSAEFEQAFNKLSSDQGSFKIELDAVSSPDSRDWFISYVAGNFQRLPDYYVGYEAYNSQSARLLASGHGVLARAKIDVLNYANQLATEDNKLVQALVNVRRDLADRYGARIRPS